MSGAGVGLVASPTPDMSSGKADHMWLPWRRTRERGGGGGGGGAWLQGKSHRQGITSWMKDITDFSNFTTGMPRCFDGFTDLF